MKITDIRVMVLDTGRDYAAPSQGGENSGVRYVCLVRVDTDEGITGWSDVETQPHVAAHYVDHPSGGEIGFESLRSALVGEDPWERERLWQKMYRYQAYFGRQGAGMHLISGIDIALWDIVGKALGAPVWRLLGAKYRDKVKAYASTTFRPTADDMKRAVAGYLAQGFLAIKFGWGVFGQDLKRDVALVKAAREEAGTAVELLVDAGWYGIDRKDPFRARALKDWVALVGELEALDVFLLEDFLHPENYEGYAEVGRHTRTLRIAAGEQYAGMYEFERLIDRGKVDVVQPDLSRCGGITVGRQIAELAMRRQIDCVPHAWLTDLLTAATLHVNAYLMRSLFLEYNVSSAFLLSHLAKNRPVMTDGYVAVPDGPGLGVEVDERVLEEYRIL